MTSGKIRVPPESDKLMTRDECRAANYTRYWPTKPCRRGHLAWRSVSSGSCSECLSEQRRGVEQIDIHPRQKALAVGEKWYWSTAPCLRGHIGWRRAIGNGQCRQCLAQRQKNPESEKRYHDSHVEQRAAYNKEWYERFKRDPEKVAKVRERAKIRRLANLDEARSKARERKKVNAPLFALHERRRRARKRAAGGKHTLEDVADIMRLQRGRCAWCRRKLKGIEHHVDHIMPLSKGGSDGRRNLQILCESCNCHKRSRDPIEWARVSGRLL